MSDNVVLLEPQGDPDQALVDCYRRLRGLPPGTMVWVCQHSCPEASIPDCDAMNCEAAMIVDPCDVQVVRGLPEQQDFAAFDSLVVRLQLNFPGDVMSEIRALGVVDYGLPKSVRGATVYIASGSFLAFARLCALAAMAGLSPSACAALIDIESTLAWQFSSVGPALLRQRFLDLRRDTASRGNVVMLLACSDFPVRALVAWEEAPRPTRKKTVMPVLPQANAGFGMWSDQGLHMGLTTSNLYAVPGDLYGPTSRVVLRVDADVADRVRMRCSDYALALPDACRDEGMLALLEWIMQELGLPAVSFPARRGDEKNDCVLPARFIRRILWAQPLGQALTPN